MDIKSLIAQMTIEEKAQLLTGDGGMLTHAIERLGIPAKYFADGPHGVRHDKSENCTSFPNLCCAAATFDTELLYEMGVALAKDCIEHDVDMLLGPGINIKRYAACGRNFEYMSEDPVVAGELGAAYINGLQSLGVAASLKHYAVNNQEKDRLSISVEVDERALREIYLKGFEIAVKRSAPASIMCAYNKLFSVWCSENKFLLTDILKDEWDYQGFVVSDWGAVQNTGRAVAAGLDLQMPHNGNMVQHIRDALADGTVTEEQIDRSLERFLAFALSEKAEKGGYDRDEQHAVARRVAANGVVLLKNDRAVLPLRENKYKTVAVVGEYGDAPLTHGQGAAEVFPRDEYVDSPLEELKKALPDCDFIYEKTYETRSFSDVMLWPEKGRFCNFIRDADIVLMFVGAMESEDSENFDRRTLELNPNQEMFIDAAADMGKKVVVVVQSGGAMIFGRWQHRVDAIVQMWLGGEAAGGAIADVLTGAVNPCGRLPETFPKKPRALDTGNGLVVRYDEGLAVGYRYYDSHPEEIAYPFGFGLSYTSFEYRDAALTRDGENIHVSLTLKNTGDLDGAEVVQIYVAKPLSCVSRVPKELIAFQKVFLQAGEDTRVSVSVPVSSLAYYNTALKRWVVEPGAYDILLASSSRDIRETLTFVSDDAAPYTIQQVSEGMIG